jgi:hypothetical protein
VPWLDRRPVSFIVHPRNPVEGLVIVAVAAVVVSAYSIFDQSNPSIKELHRNAAELGRSATVMHKKA